MTQTGHLTDQEFQETVLEYIGREFGVGAMARYIRLNLSSRGDYTRDRHQWLDGVTLEQLEQELSNKAA